MPLTPAVSVRLGQSRLGRLRSIQRGREHWTAAFPQIEAWITNRPASTAASLEPDSHAVFKNSKSIPGSVKAREVQAVATSLQLFNKVDLKTMMKGGSEGSQWGGGGLLNGRAFLVRGIIVFTALEPELTDCPLFSAEFWL